MEVGDIFLETKIFWLWKWNGSPTPTRMYALVLITKSAVLCCSDSKNAIIMSATVYNSKRMKLRNLEFI